MKIAAFDVDHTITRASTGRRLLQYGRRAGLFSIRNLLWLPYQYLRYRTGTLEIDKVAARMVGIEGLERERLIAVAEECYDLAVRNDIMDGARDLVRKHQDAGETVILATSSLSIIVQPLARDLGIVDVLCTELEFRDGFATGSFSRAPCFGEEKLRCMKEFARARNTPLAEVTFYSDSRADIPLLRAAGTAVAVNPDRELARTARRESWPILRIS